MKNTTIKSLGLTLSISVPSTVAEFDQNAKKEGACLEQAVNNILYRGVLAEFRGDFCEAVEKAFSLERKTKDTGRTKTVKDEKTGVETKESIFVYAESEAEFIDRVIASKGITRESLQPLADAVLAAKNADGTLKIVFDASATEKKVAGPKKLAAKFSDAAKQLLESGKAEQFNKKLAAAKLATFTATGETEKDVTALGWLVKAFVDYSEAQAMAKIVG